MHSVLEPAATATCAPDPIQQDAATDIASHGFGGAVRQYNAAARRRTAIATPPRRADIPLSYKDLEVPIDQPDLFKQRFNAVAPIRAEQLAVERSAGLLMPQMDSMAASQVEQIENVANKFVDIRKEETKVSGSLASVREAVAQPLPPRDESGRQRHWIRQPD